MKSKTVAVVDYGSGNLRSVSQAVAHVAAGSGLNVEVTSDPAGWCWTPSASCLPGQGHMGDCTRGLAESGLLDAVLHAAANKPLFGVCVGMQMLLDRSEEGPAEGLGLIPGEVVRFQLEGRLQADGSRFKVPQMGWNAVFHDLGRGPAHPLWDGIADGAYFYFVHSYYAKPTHPLSQRGRGRFWWSLRCSHCARQHFCDPVSPRKKRRSGLGALPEFPPLEPLIPPVPRTFHHVADSRHRPQRRPMRSPQTGRYGPIHRVRGRPGGHGPQLGGQGRAPRAPG